MKLNSLTITNFRQFYGETALVFATDEDKNVTVFHGSNGSGKTSLLNAFKWCFYGDTDFDTENDEILNKQSILDSQDGGLITVIVKVRFVHEGVQHELIRSETYRKTGLISVESVSKELCLDIISTDDGQTKRDNQPQKYINSILPPNLQSYFFFNGERIEKIAGIGQSSQVQDAIRKLIGVEIVSRAIVHLKAVSRQYRKGLQKDLPQDHLSISVKIETKESEMELLKETITSSRKQAGLLSTSIASIDADLKQYEKSQMLQEKRESIELRVVELDDAILQIKSDRKALISSRGIYVLSNRLLDKCSDIVEEKRKKGVLPYGIKEQFIDDLVEAGSCICGAKVEPNGDVYHRLMVVRQTAGNDYQESNYTSLSSFLRNIPTLTDEFSEARRKISKTLVECLDKKKVLIQESEEIGAQILKLPEEKIRQLEVEREKAVKEKNQVDDELAIKVHQQGECQKDLKKLKDEESKIRQKQLVQGEAYLGLEKADFLCDTFEELQESMDSKVRSELSGIVEETFEKIINKDFRAYISEDYELRVTRTASDGNEYPVNEQSTGERQVTSLSFISSLISLAKTRHKEEKSRLFQGGVYPLVMDSPFGALDGDYREKIARGVPELADQVVMFVSDTQWKGKVQEACDSRVGKAFQLKIVKAPSHEFEHSTAEEIT